MRIRHERSRDGDRQQTRFLHLHHRLVFKAFAPLAVFHRLRAWWRRRTKQRLREFTAQRITHKWPWIGDNGRHFLVQPRLVAAAEDELGDKIRRPPRGLAERDAQTEKIVGVYETPPSLLCGCQTKLQELVAVLVQHKHAIELGIESITQERIV